MVISSKFDSVKHNNDHVISYYNDADLTDPELLLREIQDCILNRVDTSDPSP